MGTATAVSARRGAVSQRRRCGSSGLPAIVFPAAELREERECAGCEGAAYFQVSNGDFLCELCCIRRLHNNGVLPEYNADGSLFRGRLGRPVAHPPRREPIPRMCAVRMPKLGGDRARYDLWLQGIAPLNDPYARQCLRACTALDLA